MKRQITGFLVWVCLSSVSVAGPIVDSGSGCIIGPFGGQSANFYKGDYLPANYFARGLVYKVGDKIVYNKSVCETTDSQTHRPTCPMNCRQHHSIPREVIF
jgi:hypothetical protein